MADPIKTVPKAASPVVSITVAPNRTIQLPAPDTEGSIKTYGSGETMNVDAAEAKRLRALGFALPETMLEKPTPEPEG